VALAPDLYGKETTDEPDEAQRMMMNLQMDEVARQMSGAVDLLAGHEAVSGDKVGSMGYCLGGGLSIWAASVNDKVGPAVSFYGVFPHGKPDFGAIEGPVQGHFGTADDFIPVDDAKSLEAELQQAGAEAAFEFYEGAGHAFFADHNRLGTYHPEHAQAAWGRTVDFFKRHLNHS